MFVFINGQTKETKEKNTVSKKAVSLRKLSGCLTHNIFIQVQVCSKANEFLALDNTEQLAGITFHSPTGCPLRMIMEDKERKIHQGNQKRDTYLKTALQREAH